MSGRKKSVTLRWKRLARWPGDAGTPRGWELFWGKALLGRVRPLRDPTDSRRVVGWHYYAREDVLGVPPHAVAATGVTAEAAREACVTYVTDCLLVAHPNHEFKAPTSCPGVKP